MSGLSKNADILLGDLTCGLRQYSPVEHGAIIGAALRAMNAEIARLTAALEAKGAEVRRPCAATFPEGTDAIHRIMTRAIEARPNEPPAEADLIAAAVAAFADEAEGAVCSYCRRRLPIAANGDHVEEGGGLRPCRARHIRAIPRSRASLDRLLAEAREEEWGKAMHEVASLAGLPCLSSFKDLIAAIKERGRREGIEWAVQHPRFSGDCHLESDESYRARGLAALGFGERD